MAVGNNITWKKRERGSNAIFPNNEAARKNIKGERGTEISGKKIKIIKTWAWKEYQVVGT